MRWIIIGATLMLIGVVNVWFGTIRIDELRPAVEAANLYKINTSQGSAGAALSSSTSMSILRPIAAYEFYRVVVSGGKILCAFGALMLLVGITLQGLSDSSKSA